MKQAILLALTITLITLSGCSKSVKNEANFLTWRENYLSTDQHEIKADITASDEEKICEYTLLYSCSRNGETVEVLAPELIAQIKADIEKDETRLSYDGAVLETGSALSEKLSPLMALPTFMDFVKEGHLENAWIEDEGGTKLLVTELEMPDGMIMTLWQNRGDMVPVYADIRSNDTVGIKVNITQFS